MAGTMGTLLGMAQDLQSWNSSHNYLMQPAAVPDPGYYWWWLGTLTSHVRMLTGVLHSLFWLAASMEHCEGGVCLALWVNIVSICT